MRPAARYNCRAARFLPMLLKLTAAAAKGTQPPLQSERGGRCPTSQATKPPTAGMAGNRACREEMEDAVYVASVLVTAVVVSVLALRWNVGIGRKVDPLNHAEDFVHLRRLLVATGDHAVARRAASARLASARTASSGSAERALSSVRRAAGSR